MTDEFNNSVPAATELVRIPEYDFEAEDFYTEEPYKALEDFKGSPFMYELAVKKLAANAKAVKVHGFRDLLKKYNETQMAVRRREAVQETTDFGDDEPVELKCGYWEATSWGIFRDTPNGGKECACSHPIMPVARLVNIDTGDVKVKLGYKTPSTRGGGWRYTVVDKSVISTARNITALASQGISVTSNTASALVDYLNDLENYNYDNIPEQKSIGRLGYIEGEGFSPYVEGLVFDGDATYKHLYSYVRSHGSVAKWYETALECRQMSLTARILLAASFASPLLAVVGALPFFVHMWGGSETGKTVALMLAASVWADPLKGRFVQTFNATRVGQEMTAAFLNHLPMCIDELQLTKNGKGQSSFDVYQLAEGVGRTRGKKTGGVEMTPTWDCCFLTTGEDPIVGMSAGGGAVNRVIEIECFTDQKVITDGPRVSSILKQNYGFAGRLFVDKLYSSDEVLEFVKETYQQYFTELSQNDTTDKQSLAAAAILTADFLATEWIFKDGNNLRVDEIKQFLASRAAVSVGARAYDWMCNWIAENQNHFYTDHSDPTATSVYGKIEGNVAYINNNVLSAALNDNNFNSTATYSYLKSKDLLLPGNGRGYGFVKSIGGVKSYCIAVKMPSEDVNDTEIL